MARRTTLVAVWLAGTALSVGLGWGAVGLVRSNVDLSSTAATRFTPDDFGTSASPSRSSPAGRPSPSPSPSTASGRTTRTYALRGGSAQVVCHGTAISLGYATPAAGFEVTVHDDPGELSVRFRSETHESRLDATCVGGTPSGRLREDPR